MKRLKSYKEILNQPEGAVFNIYHKSLDCNMVVELTGLGKWADGSIMMQMGDPNTTILYHPFVNPYDDYIEVLDIIE